ncbi:hypothetical protein I6N96_00105 [Enterococcus sp. BWM-S5]|uniref:Leucine-rich repeat domain-containing protein n=1 Tax=Enterococcus larvae TaxID=2794352 RepID=A0ABS4CFG1_9ENTE|nr:hypothetical protein [Enterococcus larvae]MBP1044662.1 hypothetical protein [Enterococcus larvae]
MKVKKMFLRTLVCVGMLGSLFIGGTVSAEENESVYIPDFNVRDALAGSFLNQLPTQSDLADLEMDSLYTIAGQDPLNANLSGFQHVANLKELVVMYGTSIMDYRPISAMTNLESLHFNLPGSEFPKHFADLDFVTNLKKLKSFSFEKNVLDLTPLDELPELTEVSIGYAYAAPTTSTVKHLISNTTRELVFANPVTFSSHFDGGELIVTDRDRYTENIEVSQDEKVIKVSEIPAGSESIVLMFKNSNYSEGCYADYIMEYEIPLVWYDM